MTQEHSAPAELVATEHRFRRLVKDLKISSDPVSAFYHRAASAMATQLRKTRMAGGSSSELLPKALALAKEIDEFLERRRRDLEHGQHAYAQVMSMPTDTGLD